MTIFILVQKAIILLFLLTFTGMSHLESRPVDPDTLLNHSRHLSDSVLNSLFKKIHTHYSDGSPDSAILLVNLGLEEAIRRGSQEFIMDMHIRLGNSYIDLSDYTSAQEHLNEALAIAEENLYTTALSVIYANLAIVFSVLENNPAAIQYYQKAMAMDSLQEDWIGVGINLSNMGGILIAQGKNDEAKANYLKVLELYRASKRPFLESVALNNLGELYLLSFQYDSALICLYQSLEIKKEHASTKSLAPSFLTIGQVYLRSGEADSAFKYFQLAYQLSDSLRLHLELKEAGMGLSEFYKIKGDYKKAYTFYKEASILNDTIFTLEKNKKINELEIKYQVSQKNQEIELLNERVQAQMRVRNMGILILILVIGIFVSTYLRLRLRSQLLQQKVNAKNRELMAQSMLSVQKNETLNALKEQMSSVSHPETQASGVIKLIDESFSVEKDWEQLKVHFEEVHAGFFTKLQRDFPKLTPTDLRHCAYIHIQLSTKDIARIMNVDPKSVKMTRYRLKKKLNLREDDNLEKFLNTY